MLQIKSEVNTQNIIEGTIDIRREAQLLEHRLIDRQHDAKDGPVQQKMSIGQNTIITSRVMYNVMHSYCHVMHT